MKKKLSEMSFQELKDYKFKLMERNDRIIRNSILFVLILLIIYMSFLIYLKYFW